MHTETDMGQQRIHWGKNVIEIHIHKVSLSKIMIVKKVNFQAGVLAVSYGCQLLISLDQGHLKVAFRRLN